MIIWGSKGREKVVEKGEFFCPQCDAAKPYERVRVAKYFTLYFIPLFETEVVGGYVRCLGCLQSYQTSVLTLEVYECTECSGDLNKSDRFCRHCGADTSEDLTGVEDVGSLIARMSAEVQRSLRTQLCSLNFSDKNSDWDAVIGELSGFFLHYSSRFYFSALPREKHSQLVDQIYLSVGSSVAKAMQVPGLVDAGDLLGNIGQILQDAEVNYGRATKVYDKVTPMSQDSLYGALAHRVARALGSRVDVFVALYVFETVQATMRALKFEELLHQVAEQHGAYPDIPL